MGATGVEASAAELCAALVDAGFDTAAAAVRPAG